MIKKVFLVALISALALSLFGLLSLSIVSAEEDEIQRLQKKISELEERIRGLETLLNEYQIKESVQVSSVYEWENKKNWRKLEIGMNESQVQKILGEPAKMIKGVRTLWYYPNKYCGYVSFDENGCLSGWNEP